MKRLSCFRGSVRLTTLAAAAAIGFLASPIAANLASARVSPSPSRTLPRSNEAAPFAPTLTPSLAGSAVEGVIVTADSLAATFQPLADFHTRTGHPTVVRTLGTIRAEDPRSNDLAQAIRSFLTRARTLWGTEWVLLAGDHESIPLRLVQVTYFETEEIATDVYYSDLDGTWDGNGNGIYGEVADALDMEPDLDVGRVSFSNRTDAEAQVAKLLRYRRVPPLEAASKQVFLAEVLFPRDWTPGQLVQVDSAIEGESLRVHAPACVAIDRLYENVTRYPGSQLLTKASAIQALSKPHGLVQHLGHGSRSQISVGSELITLGDVSAPTFGDSTFFWVASNCASAAVDFDCFAEAVLRKPGGAIGYVGATRDEWPGVSETLAEVFTDLTIPKQGAPTTIGRAVTEARRALFPAATGESPERWGYFETILLGDPALHLWNCAPRTLAVAAPASVPLGAAGFTATVTSGGAPVESALVVAMKDGEDYRAVWTDAAGQAWVPFRPASAGSFFLTVSAPNAIAFESTRSVTAAAAAHFRFVSLVDSDAVHGDGDGRADAGERFGFTGSIQNSGTGASGNPVTIEAQALSGGLVVEQATATLASIAAGGSAAFPSTIRLLAAASPNAARAEQVRLIARDATRADTIVVGVDVSAASLLLATAAFADNAPGDGDGIPEAGETAAWTWTLANAGSGAARGVTLRARTPAAGVTLLDSVATAGDIPPGGQAAASAAIRISLAGAVAGRLFDLHLLDARGHATIVAVSRAALPGAPAGLHVNASSSNRVALGWNAVAAPRLLGYHVYRAFDDGSPLARVTPAPVRAIPEFEDAGLALLTRYRYAATAVDSSGNEGSLSPPIVASTTPPTAVGWPAEFGQPTSSNVCLGDLDGDGHPELVVGADYLYAFHADGTEVRDGDANPATVGIFSTLLHNIASSPAIADVDLDGTPEIIAASWNDSLVAVFRPDGTLLPGWPKRGAAPFWSSPAI
ncbi:MAG TPA: C25 family cysteine peptidase, partial [Candidatus Eisenbacteria bacterium]|nr:C25 family cysteine peptidase [Candidatus Eisenbacteria bacterium]